MGARGPPLHEFETTDWLWLRMLISVLARQSAYQFVAAATETERVLVDGDTPCRTLYRGPRQPQPARRQATCRQLL